MASMLGVKSTAVISKLNDYQVRVLRAGGNVSHSSSNNIGIKRRVIQLAKQPSFKDRLDQAKVGKAPIKDRIKKAIKGSKPVVEAKDVAKAQVEAIKAQGQALERIEHFQAVVASFGSITTEGQYLEADNILGQIKALKDWWEPLVRKPIDFIRAGLDALYELNREVTKPIEAVEASIKGAMKGYKLEEQRQKRLIQDEIDLKKRALELASAPTVRLPAPQRVAMHEQIGQLEQIRQQVEEVQGVQGQDSHARVKKVWEVQDKDIPAFIKAVASGQIPLNVLIINRVQMNEYWRQDEETVSSWTGVTVKEDVVIAHGRKSY